MAAPPGSFGAEHLSPSNQPPMFLPRTPQWMHITPNWNGHPPPSLDNRADHLLPRTTQAGREQRAISEEKPNIQPSWQPGLAEKQTDAVSLESTAPSPAQSEEGIERLAELVEGDEDEATESLQLLNADRRLYSPQGGLELLRGCVVVDVKGTLGVWNGFSWIERRQRPGWDVLKIAHDSNRYLWSLSRDGRFGRLTYEGWKSVGPVGNSTIRDFAFDAQNRLWTALSHGDVAHWNGYSWQSSTAKFRKVIALASDAMKNLWAMNWARELGRWDPDKHCWVTQSLPPGFRPDNLAFDPYNQLWAVNSEGMLAQLSGKRWILLGHVAGWKVADLSWFSRDDIGGNE